MSAADAPRPGSPSREPVERDLTRASATADAAAATALAAQPARPDTSAVSLTALFDSGPDPHRGATCRPTCGANRASGQHSGGVTSAFTSLHEIANQALSAGGHVAMEISTTTSARQARPGPPPGAPPPPGATQLSQRCTYPTVYPAAYSTATAVTACPDEVPLAEASVLWQGFSPDGFGEVAPGYALASAAPKGRRRKQSAARSDAHGNHWQWTHGPLSVEEAWRDQHYQERVTSEGVASGCGRPGDGTVSSRGQAALARLERPAQAERQRLAVNCGFVSRGKNVGRCCWGDGARAR